MSNRAITWAMNVEAPSSTAKFVLFVLANFHNEKEDAAWPSIAMFQKVTMLSDRTIQKALKELREASLISLQIGGGRENTNRYKLSIKTRSSDGVSVSKPRRIFGVKDSINPEEFALNPEDIAVNPEESSGNTLDTLNTLGIRTKKKRAKKRTLKFVKPTQEEINTYCLEKKFNNFDADRFIDYYESIGWKIGNRPMKSWQATVNNWNRRNKNTTTENNDMGDGAV